MVAVAFTTVMSQEKRGEDTVLRVGGHKGKMSADPCLDLWSPTPSCCFAHCPLADCQYIKAFEKYSIKQI